MFGAIIGPIMFLKEDLKLLYSFFKNLQTLIYVRQ